ncbi:hypothetical protein [Thauera propionica]|uniref:hypothetical protein n=1 Tax=Thauera propionica TaxID=2019431 RepID=UPI0023F31208|nr:hypothetical protein [Thauera propionica]MDD3675882.1 hypothetical protein [Thauera propionica]
MRTLTDAALSAAAGTVTKPLYLIEIGFTPALRLSTRGDVTWNALAWSGGEAIAVSSLDADGSGWQSGTIQIGNLDDYVGTLILAQGVADRPVMVWKADGTALDVADPVLVFDGVATSADVDTSRVSLSLAGAGTRSAFAPRRVIGPASGFSFLLPAGTKIKIGATTYTLERQ